MKKFLAIPLSIALVLSMSNAFATDPVLNEGIVRLHPSAQVTRHCALSLVDTNGLALNQAGYDIGATQSDESNGGGDPAVGGVSPDGLNFGDIYQQKGAAEAIVKRTAHVYVQCNDDFKITALSSYGGMKLSGTAAAKGAKAASESLTANKNLDYQVSEVSVGAMKLIGKTGDAPVMASGMELTPKNMQIVLADAQKPVAEGGLGTVVVDARGKIELSIKKGQYPQGGYEDTITVELAAY